jgi:hypothetical protein
MGPPCQHRLPVREFTLAVPRTPPVSHLPFPNLTSAHSAVDAPTSRVSQPLPSRVQPPFELAPTRSLTSSSSAPLQTPSHPPSHCARARGAPPLCAVTSGPFRDRRRAPVSSVAPVSSASSPATQDTLWFAPIPSISLCSCSPDFSPCSRVPVVIDQGFRCVLVIAQVLQNHLLR